MCAQLRNRLVRIHVLVRLTPQTTFTNAISCYACLPSIKPGQQSLSIFIFSNLRIHLATFTCFDVECLATDHWRRLIMPAKTTAGEIFLIERSCSVDTFPDVVNCPGVVSAHAR